jgi:hypothetical protein
LETVQWLRLGCLCRTDDARKRIQKLRWNVEGYKWNLRTTCNAILDYSVHILKTWVKKKWWKYLLQSSANKSMQVDLCNSVSSSIVFYFAV